jgi:hypothetical protein
MRLTQVEIQTRRNHLRPNDPVETRVYWLDDDPYNDRGLKVGSMVMLAEEGVATYWAITKLFTSVSDGMKEWLRTNLKARTGTILELMNA